MILSKSPTYGSEPGNFGGLPEGLSSWKNSGVVVLPVPYEATTSYRKGTWQGPQAVLEASRHLELFDEELKTDTASRVGIHTLPPLISAEAAGRAALLGMAEVSAEIVRAGKWLLSLGGEHSLSWGLVKGVKKIYPRLGVLHFDAHADLRSEYLGDPYSHACAHYLIRQLGCPTVSVGIRSLSGPEYKLIKKEKVPIFLSPLTDDPGQARPPLKEIVTQILALLPRDVYITIDLDAFDPSIMPAVGTPEPGGLSWAEVLSILRPVFRRKNVVAADIVELAPLGDDPSADFLAAKLGYRLMGYKFQKS